MGAWGTETFDNDAASDWAGEFADAGDLSFVEETFNEVLEEGGDYLDSDEACRGLAACEVIARLKGNWGVKNAYSEDVDEWVEANPQKQSDELVRKALAVIDRVRAENSELPELWGEGDASAWNAAVDDLRQRVAG
jgi:hypothetical protein